ncbi:hypothetical protein SAMN05216308_104221 [Nitrosospira sp. Nsp13]|nr:hypothetical protein SAMN05216308_104221 [Nitrosospira sp. Nsp13]
MTILTRVEALEAALLKPKEDERYKLVLLKKGESREEGIIRSELQDWPPDKIIVITFVSPKNIDC